jgi:hypothetical protein
VTPGQREAFARLADELLPATDELPAPSTVDVAGKWLDRALATRPDLADDLLRALDAGTTASALHDADPSAFAALALLAPGAYYLHPRVRRLIGYPGQKADPAPDDESAWWLRDGLLDPVAARGPIWRRPDDAR